MPRYDSEIHTTANMELSWNNTSVFLGDDEQIFPEPIRAHGNSAKDGLGLLADFKKRVQQTELHSRHVIQVEKPVSSFFLNILDKIFAGTKMHYHD